MEENKNQIDEPKRSQALIAKLYRFLRWLSINTLFAYMVYEALFNKTTWAENVVMFGAHVVFILQGISALAVKTLELKSKPIKSVPQWVDHTYDLILVMVFAAFGWFYYATLWFIQIFFVAMVYKQKDV